MHRMATLVFVVLSVAAIADAGPWTTRSGYYLVSYRSDLEPLEINRIHAWEFHVTTPDGESVNGAVISVTGGMPLHNHGLPTAPRMTTELGDGRYRVEGFRFHMRGEWELIVTVDVPGRRDTVVISLTI